MKRNLTEPLIALATLVVALGFLVREPAAATFTFTRSQTAVQISTWTGCNTALYRQQVLGSGPTAYLRMDPNGLTEPDVSTTGGSWQWSAAPTKVPGALSCDTSPGAAVSASSVLSSEGTDAVTADTVPFSYVLWMKANPSTNGVVFSSAGGLAASGAAARADRALFLRTDGTLAVAMSDGPVVTALTTTTVVADGQWHLVAVALKTTDIGTTRGTRIYVDGVLRAYDSQMRKGLPPVAGESWRLGSATLDARLGGLIPTGTFSGSVDEVAVWNRTLTDAEVSALWAARAG